MTSNSLKTRIVGSVLAAALMASVAAPTAAKADHWHHHGGGTAAAVVGVGALGLIAGTAIANSNSRSYRDDEECFLERRRYVDQYGRTYFKRIEVCQ